MNRTAIAALIRNDIRLFIADRRAVIVGVLVPILIAAFFGYVFGGGGKHQDAGRIPIALVDEDHSSISQAIIADFAADKLVQVAQLDRAAAVQLVKSGKQNAAAVFPAGFGDQTTKSLFSGRDKPKVELLVDPSQPMGARIVEGLLAQYSMQEISKEAFNGATGVRTIDSVLPRVTDPDVRALLESAKTLNARQAASGAGPGNGPGFRLSIPYSVAATEVTAADNTPYNSYAHSFAGMSVQFILFSGIDAGVLLLLTRQRGIWQRLRSAPLRRGEFILARALATTLISAFQFTVIFAAAAILFGVRAQGSLAGLIAIGLAFCLLNATFGLMLATLGRSAPATRGIATMVMLLMVMVGGAWVPAFVFPKWLQGASLYTPTRWAVDGLDGATWRGLPFDAALLPVLVLIGSAAVCLAVAIWRFSWDE